MDLYLLGVKDLKKICFYKMCVWHSVLDFVSHKESAIQSCDTKFVAVLSKELKLTKIYIQLVCYINYWWLDFSVNFPTDGCVWLFVLRLPH